MPTAPVPPEVVAFLRQPNPAVVASLRADGSPHTAATWYDWEEDGHVLLNMDESRRRLDSCAEIRESPQALGREDWGRYVTLFGRIVRIESDTDLADIDRLATATPACRSGHGTPGVTAHGWWLRPGTAGTAVARGRHSERRQVKSISRRARG